MIRRNVLGQRGFGEFDFGHSSGCCQLGEEAVGIVRLVRRRHARSLQLRVGAPEAR
jgi:hypothetical protein